jgi:hypothetical protein
MAPPGGVEVAKQALEQALALLTSIEKHLP